MAGPSTLLIEHITPTLMQPCQSCSWSICRSTLVLAAQVGQLLTSFHKSVSVQSFQPGNCLSHLMQSAIELTLAQQTNICLRHMCMYPVELLHTKSATKLPQHQRCKATDPQWGRGQVALRCTSGPGACRRWSPPVQQHRCRNSIPSVAGPRLTLSWFEMGLLMS